MAANLFDRLIGAINPDAGLRRFRARELLSRAYEGASPRDGWKPRRAGASANADHRGDATTLRVRARALVQNVPYIAGGMERKVANIVGTGLIPRSLSKNAAIIDKLHAEWAAQCDADGRLDLYGMQAAADLAMEVDGEVLIRYRTRRPEDGLAVPLQLQLLEIDWLDSSKGGKAGPNTIINGIEYDPLGKVVNYWLFDQHPGEVGTGKGRNSSSAVSASRITHLFNPKRPGQGRGITSLAPVIARVRDLQLYEDAELQRKNLETRLGVIAHGDISEVSLNPSESIGTVRQTGELGQLGSGSITNVPFGTNLTVIEPKVAPGYVEYLKHNLHIVATGMGVTYEMLTGDVSDTNFSSARVALLEFRRSAEQIQWLTLIPNLCIPIWRAFIDAAVLSGKLDKADYACDWSTPKWDYVNPEQDVKADLAEISGGLSSISEKLRRRGYKPDLVFKEIKADLERLRADGTLDVLLQLQTNQAPQQDKPGKAVSRALEEATIATNAATAAAVTEMRQQGMEQRNMLTAMFATHERNAPREPVAPVIHNHVAVPEQRAGDVHLHVPETNVTVQATMPSPTVEVRNEISTPTPSVTVNNQVQPATVAVDVTATMPARVSETVIEREPGTKNIVRSTTVERDAT